MYVYALRNIGDMDTLCCLYHTSFAKMGEIHDCDMLEHSGTGSLLWIPFEQDEPLGLENSPLIRHVKW